MKNNEIDMLHGSLWDKILLYTLPLAATYILQQLFNATDIAVVGRFAGKEAMAAVGSNSPVITLLVSLFTGISQGTNVVIASAIGQKHEKDVCEAVHTSVLVSLVGGFIAVVLGESVAAPMLHTMSVPEDVFPMALLYLRIYLVGTPIIMLYNFESAVLRASGDTKTPLVVLVISGIINVALNLIFVRVMHRTTDGVAVATVISNIISSGLLSMFIFKSKTNSSLCTYKLRINVGIMSKILQIGIPSGIQDMTFSFANVIIQTAINSLDTPIIAASSAAYNLEVFSFYILSSFGHACMTFVGQNHGAGQEKRCRQILCDCLLLDFLATASVCSILLLFGKTIIGLFNNESDVINYGYIRLVHLCIAHIFSLVVEVVSGYMRGYGVAIIPTLASLIGVCGIRIIWVYTIFRHAPTFNTLMQVYPLSLAVTAGIISTSAFVYHSLSLHSTKL